MESAQFSLVSVFPPNPTGKRATRVRWSIKPKNEKGERLVAYGTQKNLVIRDLDDPLRSKVYNQQILNDITCVKYTPNGNYIGLGDDKGGVRIIGWSSAENNFVNKYENDSLLNGPVLDLAFNEDGSKFVAVGGGQKRAVAINTDAKNSAGELTGHTASLLCCDVKIPKPNKVIVSGEDKEIQFYKGLPFKLEKSIQKVHTGFVTKVQFNRFD
mmetsp:Transcript_9265/g.15583  ORF Transcript_9265/g.15583 Transcript_9265/m.15583 type:complete len:213 (-) Transcript_9265:1340-1978(-)